MTSEKNRLNLRPLVSGAAATASLAMTGVALPAAAQAQTANADRPGDTVLDPIILKNADKANTNKASTGIARLPATIKETPKIVNVVPKQIIEQQRATTLEQALRNVPGITLSTGEGGGGQNGSQFRIRGLQARADVYVDGLKDFGVYARDIFNTEDVQVLKGPSGDNFGSGNTGGLINQSSKKARLENFVNVEQSIGSGMTYRTTVDANRQVNETTAIRFNGVVHKQDTPDRDHITNDRRGFAFDIGMGLDTGTEWHLNYSYLHGDGTPDYGQPMVEGADGIYLPAAEFGFDPSRSYARSVNRDLTNNHQISSYLSSEVTDWLTLSNDTRVTVYRRDFHGTPPGSCSVSSGCSANFFDVMNGGGDPDARFRLGAGGGVTTLQQGWAIQNVTTAKLEFDTGPVTHKANVGLDISYQSDKLTRGAWPTWSTLPGEERNMESLFNPRYDYDYSPEYDHAGARRLNATDVGIFVSDRVYLTDEFSILGGLRFNTRRTELDWIVANKTQNNHAWSPSLAVIWEPTPEYSLYASYASTSKPRTVDVSALSVSESIVNTRTGAEVRISPEKSRVYEIGAKADLLDGRLGVTGALFQVVKDNAIDLDTQLPGGSIDAPTGRRIRGIELGASGKVTESWSVFANYAYLDGEITSSGRDGEVGSDAPYVSPHNFNLWTSYTIGEELIASLPGKFTVGGGFQYASSYFVDNTNKQKIPSFFSLDAVVSYEYKNFQVALNGYNLTDHQNYGTSFRSRTVPAAGPTYMLTVGAKF